MGSNLYKATVYTHGKAEEAMNHKSGDLPETFFSNYSYGEIRGCGRFLLS